MTKTSFANWQQQNPQGKVMMPVSANWQSAPAWPVPPRYPMNATAIPAEPEHVTIVATTQPIAVPTDAIHETPLNLTAGPSAVLIFRSGMNQPAVAFDRHVEPDLSVRFARANDARRPNVTMTDSDTNTQWSAAGIAVNGPAETRGKKLASLPVQDDVYWDVIKFWYPSLQLIDDAALRASAAGSAPRPKMPRQTTHADRPPGGPTGEIAALNK